MIRKLGKVARINVRDAWLNEAAHFTPWLASEDGMELLQDALDMELEVEATEKYVGPFKADILAKRTDTTDDHWVLIENQLERTDHRHLGQLLTYAAGLEAATIVWIAESFCEEHRAALDWLNDITSDKFEFFGLEIELWQIGDSPPAPMFNVAAQPNEWTREVQQTADHQLSGYKEQQLRFWQSFADYLRETKSSLKPQKLRAQPWATFSLGRSGTWLAAMIDAKRKSLSVGLFVHGPIGKVWYDQLAAKRSDIDAKLAGLSWYRLEGKRRSKVVLSLEDSDPIDETAWPTQHAWIVEKLKLFDAVFRPLVAELTGQNFANAGDPGADDEGPEEA